MGTDNSKVRVDGHICGVDGPLAVTPLGDTQISEGVGLPDRFADRRELGAVEGDRGLQLVGVSRLLVRIVPGGHKDPPTDTCWLLGFQHRPHPPLFPAELAQLRICHGVSGARLL